MSEAASAAPVIRFDPAALRALAGAKVFDRGQDYFDDGAVEILDIGPTRVLGRVTGTDDYRVELELAGTRILGVCSCPAYRDYGFCKHMVALGLAANAFEPPAGGAVSGLARIRAHLASLGETALIDMIVDLAEADAEFWRRLDLASAVTGSDPVALESRLEKLIDEALEVDEYEDWRDATDRAAQGEAVLEALERAISGGHGEIALRLTRHLVDRIFEVIDDSEGEVVGLLERARQVHHAAALAARPDPTTLAEELFELEAEDDWGAFEGAGEAYADVLGEIGVAAYRRLAQDAWAALPPRFVERAGIRAAGRFADRSGGDRWGSEAPHPGYLRLMRILDGFAARDGDLETRVALRSKDLSSPWAFFQLAQFCAENGRRAEALGRVEEALWLFEDAAPDERLVALGAELMAESGRADEARALLLRAFERAPSLAGYERLRAMAGEAALDPAVRVLEARLVHDKAALWGHPADLLVDILRREDRPDAAWAAIAAHGASPRMRRALAEDSEDTHPAEALAVFAEQVEQLAERGGDPAYDEAAALARRMAALRPAAEHAVWLADLKARFGRRRNLMKRLP